MIFGTEKSLPLRGQNQINRSLASLCARICARMAGILLAYRESQRFLTKSSFFSRKTHRFRNEERCFEIDDFVILSLARLPIPGPTGITLRDLESVLGSPLQETRFAPKRSALFQYRTRYIPKRLVDFFTRSKAILAIVLCMPKMLAWKRLLHASGGSSKSADSVLFLRPIWSAVGQARRSRRQNEREKSKLSPNLRVGLRSFSLLSPAPGQYFGPSSQVPNCNRVATMFQARCKFGHWTCRNSSIISRTYKCAHTLILSLAVRRKGIARYAALHLDCARFADRVSLSVRVGKAVADSPIALRVITPLNGFSGSNIFGQATISWLPNTASIAEFWGISRVAEGRRSP